MNQSLLFVGVLVFMFSVSTADVSLEGQCQTEGRVYCPGEQVSFTCNSDTAGNVSVTIGDTSIQYAESDDIGREQTTIIGGVQVQYKKIDDDSVRVNFSANAALDGYTLECKDIDDYGYENCTLDVNTVPVPSAQNFSVSNPQYCDSTNFTWAYTNTSGYSCLKEFVVKGERVGSNIADFEVTFDPDDVLSYTMTETIAQTYEVCLTVASRTLYDGDQFESENQCIKFDKPKDPMGLMENYDIDNKNSEGEIEVTINWVRPDWSRPNIKQYYLWTNLTDHDDDDDDSSGSGQQPPSNNMEMMYRNIILPDSSTMMKLPGAKEGYYYTVRLTAMNCYGNSSSTITFKVERKATPTPSTQQPTTVPSDTPEPSSSPTIDEESESLPTWAIIVIAIVASLAVVAIILPIVLIICCCCCGIAICACCAAQSPSEPYEMGNRGTHL